MLIILKVELITLKLKIIYKTRVKNNKIKVNYINISVKNINSRLKNLVILNLL